jgi:hypothetical protein
LSVTPSAWLGAGQPMRLKPKSAAARVRGMERRLERWINRCWKGIWLSFAKSRGSTSGTNALQDGYKIVDGHMICAPLPLFVNRVNVPMISANSKRLVGASPSPAKHHVRCENSRQTAYFGSMFAQLTKNTSGAQII